MREFKSKPSTQERTVPFGLDGEVFTVRFPVDDASFAVEYSELAATVSADIDLMSPDGVAFTARFFRLLLGVDYPRFRAHLKAKRPHVDTLTEIMQEINEAVTTAEADDAERPTKRSPKSSRGRARGKGDRASQLAALAGADVDLRLVSGD